MGYNGSEVVRTGGDVVGTRKDTRSRVWIGLGVAALVMFASGQAVADLVYTHEVELNRWIEPFAPAVWTHVFDHSVNSPSAATLAITAADASAGEAEVWVLDSNGHWHNLGFLEASIDNISTTIFDLNPSWLDAVPVGAQIRWVSDEVNHRVWLGSSTLSVFGAPAPAALLLGAIGLGCVGLVSKLKSRGSSS
ncbi:MAG TPA: hypothetical protein VMZ31_15525 [Phycisphaerae bacterium]|nr:hypothetical protein [Phycisphaerae bacterium]